MAGASANTYLALFSRLGKKVNTHEKAQEGRTLGRGVGHSSLQGAKLGFTGRMLCEGSR